MGFIIFLKKMKIFLVLPATLRPWQTARIPVQQGTVAGSGNRRLAAAVAVAVAAAVAVVAAAAGPPTLEGPFF